MWVASSLSWRSGSPSWRPYRQPQDWQSPPLIVDESAAATNADTAASISNHVKQSMAQFATAKLDINDDGVWTTYTDAIDKMGLAQYLKNYQRAYDSRPTG
jgi:putative aldouronate transport system substrate-binding protein